VTRDGRVKILDFGLAKVQTLEPSAGDAATRGPVTDVGVVMGTVGYMSPEQVRGQAATTGLTSSPSVRSSTSSRPAAARLRARRGQKR
jgi:serine/threonine protein kinase